MFASEYAGNKALRTTNELKENPDMCGTYEENRDALITAAIAADLATYGFKPEGTGFARYWGGPFDVDQIPGRATASRECSTCTAPTPTRCSIRATSTGSGRSGSRRCSSRS